MFKRLAKKYGVPNPLESREDTVAQKSRESSESPFSKGGFGGPVGTPTTSQKPPLPSSASPFSASKSRPMSAAPISVSPTVQSPFLGGTGIAFGKTTSFGGSGIVTQSSAPFGGQASQSTVPPSPFGAGPGTQPAPTEGATSGSAQPSLVGGKSPRDMLAQFYQRYNPTKVSEVDRLLAKYKGNEELMFRNLAKKYNLDPGLFGLPAVTTPTGFGSAASPLPGSTSGFGQPSALGSNSPFGGSPQSTPLGPGGFGQTSPIGSQAGVFGTQGGSSPYGAPSFGSLAQSSSPQTGFGGMTASTLPSPFGSPTPFGGPRK